jgi:hypothetical protein
VNARRVALAVAVVLALGAGVGVLITVAVSAAAEIMTVLAAVLTTVVFAAGVAQASAADKSMPGEGRRRSLHGLLSAVLHGGAQGQETCVLAAGAGWRVMRAAARLMPPSVGGRWLGEAESFLAEAPAALARDAVRDYLATAPLVIVISWAAAISRWSQLAIRKAVR